ncbi:MAG: hypothetical protein DRJ15_15780 [Bacteroidetes bacterium]|nr:MAG: hypothetical protein DRJ15_15780 [Bacteroidota bacterium]
MQVTRITKEEFVELDKLLRRYYPTNAIDGTQQIITKELGKPISKHQIRRRKTMLGLTLTRETKSRLAKNTHKAHTQKKTVQEIFAIAIFRKYLWDKGYSFCAKELGLTRVATTALANRLGFKVNPAVLKHQAKRNAKRKIEYRKEHEIVIFGIRKPIDIVDPVEQLAAYLPWRKNYIRELRPSYIQDWPK